jgi:BirA family biotin operon repressor/biotin-[acetyl-CoA-carboxylase] ligase
MNDKWTAQSFESQFLELGLINWQLVVLSETVSTMDDARSLVTKGISQPVCIISRQQQGGRGQQGRVWTSLPGGFYATYVFPLTAGVAIAGFSLVTGIVIAQLLAAYAIKAKLKWPNDVLTTDGKKLAGILTEVVPTSAGQALLVGIGINFSNQVDDQKASSLELLGVKELEIAHAAAILGRNLQRSLIDFVENGLAAFLTTWNQYDYLLGRRICITLASEQREGIVEGISNQGALLLNCAGAIQQIWSGHIIEVYPN